MFFLENPLIELLITPLIGCFGLLFINEPKKIKNFSICITFITFFNSLFLFISFDQFITEFQFLFKLNWLQNFNINLIFGIDGISLLFILLTTLLIPLCLLTSYQVIKIKIKEYFFCFLFLEVLLLFIFSTLDLFFFYIFFESVLIPMFLLIGIWGSRERKIRASFLFFLYTLIGSLLMLLSILSIYNLTGTTDYLKLLTFSFNPFNQKIYWLCFFASFAVKVPMLPFHIWLPEAHVEAPTAGSVLLAGILLKLGSYGLLRFSLPLFPIATIYFTPLICTMAVIAVIYTSLTAIRQTDMKRVIAYASVAHMNLILLGMFSLTIEGIEGSILQMLSHGLVSSGLFLCIGALYDRYHSRLISYYSGLVQHMPLFSSIFLIYTLANIALPGTSSFVGEFLILIGVFSYNTLFAFLGATSMVFGGAYSLWLYNRIIFGNLKNINLKNFSDITYREFWVHIPLIINIFIMGLYPNIFLNIMHMSVINLVIPLKLIF
jgi:proton-translocating NADH-quinone oxidoreductase chain M